MASQAAIEAGASLAEILKATALESLDARILLGYGLGLTRVQLITLSSRCVDAEEALRIHQLFQRRLEGEPIAYIVGEREFFGIPLFVTPAVLIPRADTELLVELALQKLPHRGNLLDMGTGSGAIPIAIALQRDDAQLTALDNSEAALAVAQRNLTRHHARVQLLHSDWYHALNLPLKLPLSLQKFDVITANPPYIVAGDAHLTEGDLRFEPLNALTDHADGLSAVRAIVSGAQPFLAAGGWLLLEHGYDQASSVRDLFHHHDFEAVQSWTDLQGIERVTGGQSAGRTDGTL